MENLVIEGTKYTPEINLDVQKGSFKFKGKSYPENTFEFYEPVQEWINQYFATNYSDKKTLISFDINYLNSSSIKFYYDLFEILEDSSKEGKDVVVQWIYDEEDDMALEAGEDFKEEYEDLNINLVVK